MQLSLTEPSPRLLTHHTHISHQQDVRPQVPSAAPSAAPSEDDVEDEEEDNDGEANNEDDEEDRRVVALGFAAYQNDFEEPMPDTTDHEATAVPATFADPLESISQDEIDSSVLQLTTNVQESRAEYENQRFSSIRLSDLKRWYETGNVHSAMNSLHDKHNLHIDSQFLMSTDNPMFVFGRPEVRVPVLPRSPLSSHSRRDRSASTARLSSGSDLASTLRCPTCAHRV